MSKKVNLIINSKTMSKYFVSIDKSILLAARRNKQPLSRRTVSMCPEKTRSPQLEVGDAWLGLGLGLGFGFGLGLGLGVDLGLGQVSAVGGDQCMQAWCKSMSARPLGCAARHSEPVG